MKTLNGGDSRNDSQFAQKGGDILNEHPSSHCEACEFNCKAEEAGKVRVRGPGAPLWRAVGCSTGGMSACVHVSWLFWQCSLARSCGCKGLLERERGPLAVTLQTLEATAVLAEPAKKVASWRGRQLLGRGHSEAAVLENIIKCLPFFHLEKGVASKPFILIFLSNAVYSFTPLGTDLSPSFWSVGKGCFYVHFSSFRFFPSISRAYSIF